MSHNLAEPQLMRPEQSSHCKALVSPRQLDLSLEAAVRMLLSCRWGRRATGSWRRRGLDKRFRGRDQ